MAALTNSIDWLEAEAENSKQKFAAADIQLALAEALPSKMNSLIGKERVGRPEEPDVVSEKIAQSLLQQLEAWPGKGKEMTEALLECSAQQASTMDGDRSSCVEKYNGAVDVQCLVQRGYGRKSIGQILTTDRLDLNNDCVADYIIKDRYYCNQLSANQSNVYFVLLSRSKNDFRLAYADWASYGLEVVKSPVDGTNVLIERAPKSWGVFNRIMQLSNGEFTTRICIFEDKTGFSRCGAASD